MHHTFENGLDYLVVDTLEDVLSQIYEEYGGDSKCDLKLSMNHDLISENLEEVKVNGFSIDKKGTV